MTPTPGDVAPDVVQRTQLVAQAMNALEETEELPAAEQLVLLGQAQRILAGVLAGDPNVAQLGLPGVQ